MKDIKFWWFLMTHYSPKKEIVSKQTIFHLYAGPLGELGNEWHVCFADRPEVPWCGFYSENPQTNWIYHHVKLLFFPNYKIPYISPFYHLPFHRHMIRDILAGYEKENIPLLSATKQLKQFI